MKEVAGENVRSEPELKRQIEALVEILGCITTNVEAVVGSLKRTTVQLHAVASRLLLESRDSDGRFATALAEAPSLGNCTERVFEAIRRDILDRETMRNSNFPARESIRSPISGSAQRHARGLDEVHDLDWDAVGLELGHSVCLSSGTDTTCEPTDSTQTRLNVELLHFPEHGNSHEVIKDSNFQVSAAKNSAVLGNNYEFEDMMELALEHSIPDEEYEIPDEEYEIPDDTLEEAQTGGNLQENKRLSLLVGDTNGDGSFEQGDDDVDSCVTFCESQYDRGLNTWMTFATTFAED